MTIETELNIGDVVYYIQNGVIYETEICFIEVEIKKSSITLRYWAWDEKGGMIESDEPFISKEELIKYFFADVVKVKAGVTE